MHATSPALDLLTTLPGVGPRRAAALLAHHGDALWTQLEKDPAAALTCPGGLPVSQLKPALAAWAQMRAGRDLHELLSHGGRRRTMGAIRLCVRIRERIGQTWEHGVIAESTRLRPDVTAVA